MIEEIMDYIHNYFDYKRVAGTFVVSSGGLDCDFLQNGQYFKIVGSVFNDGVWQYPSTELHDETFTGEVWALAVPPRITQLATEISKWVDDNQEALNSPYQSESFGGYSYSKASGGSSGGAENAYSWRQVFGAQLNQWRKLS